MLLDILFIIGGAAVVLFGADKLTDGAVAVAEKLHIPQIVIGLTIVAMGTSMPEFCVSLVSALKGTPDMAVGNVIGSNIFNTLLIVGMAALVSPITVLPATVKKDIPFALMASCLLTSLVSDGLLSRLDSAILFALFLAFMVMTVQTAKKGSTEEAAEAKNYPIGKSLLLIALGLVCLIGGSNVFVQGASNVAATLGVSDAVIGLTVVAMGTSLPELATTVVSARKGNSGIAIGNVLGSNVFNILMILGITGLICPMDIVGITRLDLAMLAVSMFLLWLFSFTKLTIQRWEGAILTALFTCYLVYLVVMAI